MDRLQGKIAIITGASLGLGRATAIRMAEEGASIAVLDRDVEGASALAAGLAARGFPARAWSSLGHLARRRIPRQTLRARRPAIRRARGPTA